MRNTDTVIFTLDTKTKEAEEIFRYNRVDGYGQRHFYNGEFMYVYDYDDDSAIEVNMLTGEQTAHESFSPVDGYMYNMLDGRFVYAPLVEGDEPKDRPRYFSDPSTGEITKTELHSPHMAGSLNSGFGRHVRGRLCADTRRGDQH